MRRRFQFSLSRLFGAMSLFTFAALCAILPPYCAPASGIGLLVAIAGGLRVLIDDTRIYMTVVLSLIGLWFVLAILVIFTIGPGP